jgi:hypothetical protein
MRNSIDVLLHSIREKSGTFGRDISIAVLRKWQGFRKVQCNQCDHVWADPQLNDPCLRCPMCKGFKLDRADYEIN